MSLDITSKLDTYSIEYFSVKVLTSTIPDEGNLSSQSKVGWTILSAVSG